MANPCLPSHPQVHFRNGMGGDPRLSENVDDLVRVLDGLGELVKAKSQSLEQTLAQIDVYQQQMQTLRQRIIQEEQQLRLVMAPTYLPHDRERALAEQQVRTVQSLTEIVDPFSKNQLAVQFRYSRYCQEISLVKSVIPFKKPPFYIYLYIISSSL